MSVTRTVSLVYSVGLQTCEMREAKVVGVLLSLLCAAALVLAMPQPGTVGEKVRVSRERGRARALPGSDSAAAGLADRFKTRTKMSSGNNPTKREDSKFWPL